MQCEVRRRAGWGRVLHETLYTKGCLIERRRVYVCDSKGEAESKGRGGKEKEKGPGLTKAVTDSCQERESTVSQHYVKDPKGDHKTSTEKSMWGVGARANE